MLLSPCKNVKFTWIILLNESFECKCCYFSDLWTFINRPHFYASTHRSLVVTSDQRWPFLWICRVFLSRHQWARRLHQGSSLSLIWDGRVYPLRSVKQLKCIWIPREWCTTFHMKSAIKTLSTKKSLSTVGLFYSYHLNTELLLHIQKCHSCSS